MPDNLTKDIKKGWLRLPFRPTPLENIPDGESGIPPAFRIGATEALSPGPIYGQNEKGAAGTMAIPLPPNTSKLTRFRIAGERNEGGIHIKLLVGGWEPHENRHNIETILDEEISSSGPFHETYDIQKQLIEPDFRTLSIWVRGVLRTSISLIAVELVY